MAELTLDQQKAIAIARARMRLSQQQPQPAAAVSAPQQQQMPIYTGVGDVVKSLGTGAVKGGVGSVTGGVDLGMLLSDYAIQPGFQWLADKLGIEVTPEAKAYAEQSRKSAEQSGTGAAIGNIEKQFGPLYQPQSHVGRYAEAAGEMVPSALTGPGTLLRKGVSA